MDKLNPEKVRVTTRVMYVDDMLKRLEAGKLTDFPTDDLDFADMLYLSRIVEAVILRVPLPPVYVGADYEDFWTVYRDSYIVLALSAYVNGHFELETTYDIDDAPGRRYADLPRWLQRRIMSTNLTFHIAEPTGNRAVDENLELLMGGHF